mmetsp:Transcript_30256/g.42875  ORF Transcript_30256/g.42875 Transcript_30256/m.42875 type:complete len:253 (-) Transcript_30256:102-860(-)|eukprot:CAMPEP_0202457984 /NCGR_PEP_ID=MMETSP1360-20130828/19116_1 /ASSEMBLY_ACC=CAM_ASM_000848 /TAXON_ID=515479 /ORGANISM="Licmophora paradoxa, Strain CCMP2313" /LENGTH=252 /DNA_ID=CAMNT_0049078253 /DNA_START=40 /DNA_END=798 /DNA_ORIENTATION=+
MTKLNLFFLLLALALAFCSAGTKGSGSSEDYEKMMGKKGKKDSSVSMSASESSSEDVESSSEDVETSSEDMESSSEDMESASEDTESETVAPVATEVTEPETAAPVATEPETNTIVDVADALGFETLLELVVQAGLADLLADNGPFTVFAPSEDAFAALGEETLLELLGNEDALRNTLSYHVVPGVLFSDDLPSEGFVATSQGASIVVRSSVDGVIINDMANVIMADVEADNGVIHVIDNVLMPPVLPVDDD